MGIPEGLFERTLFLFRSQQDELEGWKLESWMLDAGCCLSGSLIRFWPGDEPRNPRKGQSGATSY
jgi:hypothetical protein